MLEPVVHEGLPYRIKPLATEDSHRGWRGTGRVIRQGVALHLFEVGGGSPINFRRPTLTIPELTFNRQTDCHSMQSGLQRVGLKT